MTWTKTFPSLPSELGTTASSLSSALGVARNALQVARTTVAAETALLNSQASGTLGGVQGALRGLASAVRSALDAALDDAGAYVLLVPLPKKGLPLWIPGMDTPLPRAPVGALSHSVPAAVRQTPLWQRAFEQSTLFLGGNAHFLRTVTEACFDAGDAQRPTFNEDSFWGYAAIVGGATDLGAATTVAAYAARLFGGSTGAEEVRPGRGYTDILVDGLVARDGPRGAVIEVEWRTPGVRALDDGSWSLVPTDYAVIRTEGPESLAARHVLDLFASVDLREGMSGRANAVVLKVARHNGIIRRYVDETTLDPDKTYYYFLAYKGRLESNTGRQQAYPYDLLSGPARMRRAPRAVRRTRHGIAPDWVRTPSVVAIIPSLNALVGRIIAAIDSAARVAEDTVSLTSTALAAIDAEITRVTKIVGDLDLILSQLDQVYTTPDANIYVTLRSGRGNVANMISDLTSALQDPADPGRPPFDSGDEYVTGAIVVVTAPSEAQFLAVWALLRMLFEEDEADPVVAGVNAFPAAPANTAATPLTQEPASVTFDTAMNPRAPGEPDASCE